MNDSQIGALVLAKCAAHDPWFPNGGEAMALAWGTVFARHKLALDDLLAAVEVAYGANGAGFKPLPADIAKAAREIRRDRAEREPEADRQARIAAQDARPEVAAAMGRRTAIEEFTGRIGRP